MRLSIGTQSTLVLFAGVLVWALATGDGFWAPTLLGALAATLLHEVGHVVGAALVGVEVDVVRVTPFGGSVSYAGEPDDAQRAAVSIAGPAASAVGVLSGLLAPVLDGAAFHAVLALSALSVWHVLVNLVPIGGTDGAEVLRAVRRRGGSRARP